MNPILFSQSGLSRQEQRTPVPASKATVDGSNKSTITANDYATDNRAFREPALSNPRNLSSNAFNPIEPEIYIPAQNESLGYDGALLIQNDAQWSDYNTTEVLNRKESVQNLKKILSLSTKDQKLDRQELLKLADAVDDVSRAFISKEKENHRQTHLIAQLNQLLEKQGLPKIVDNNHDQYIDVSEVVAHMGKLRGAIALAFASDKKTDQEFSHGFSVSSFKQLAGALVNYRASLSGELIARDLANQGLTNGLSTSEISLVLNKEAIVPGAQSFPLSTEGAKISNKSEEYYEESKLYFNDIDKNEYKNRGPFYNIVNDLVKLSFEEKGIDFESVPDAQIKTQKIKVTGLMKGLFSRSVELHDGADGQKRADFGELFKSYYLSLNQEGKDAFLKKFSNTMVNMGPMPGQRSAMVSDPGVLAGAQAAAAGADIHFDGFMNEIDAQLGQGFSAAVGLDGMGDYFEFKEDIAEIQQDVGASMLLGGLTAVAVTTALRAIVGNDRPEHRKYFQQAAQSFTDGMVDSKGINQFNAHMEKYDIKPSTKMSEAARTMIKFGRGAQNYGPAIVGGIAGVTVGVASFLAQLAAES